MQVILLERIEKLGFMGDVVNVKPGFARNYLLPQKKALRATKENVSVFETQKATLEAENIKRREDAEKAAKKADSSVLAVIRQAGDTGHLYGSVTAKDIAKVARDNKIEIQSQQVRIPRPIKEIGLHEATVMLHPEVSMKLIINVAKSEEEAATQWANRDKPAEAKEAAPAAAEAPAETPAEEAAEAN